MTHTTPSHHPDSSATPPASAAGVFGDRLQLAEKYHDLLATDGHTRGFIGPREIPKLWDRHIINCAIAESVFPQASRVTDIGSGAGLPGIPLAIARPDLKVTLVETLLKRCVFLTEVVETLGLDNVTVVRGRAEDRQTIAAAGAAQCVTSRAVAPLGKLVRWSMPLVAPGGFIAAFKGASAAEEITRDARDIRAAGGNTPTITTIGENIVAEPATIVTITKRR